MTRGHVGHVSVACICVEPVKCVNDITHVPSFCQFADCTVIFVGDEVPISHRFAGQ